MEDEAYLLELITEEEGFEDPMQLLTEYALESVVPGICKECEAIYHYEPDQDEGYCEQCGENTVVSCLILAGIM
jgi:hypothetical protein